MARHDHEHSAFHADLRSLLDHIAGGKNNFTPDEEKAISNPQHPDMFLVTCIDSRIQPDKALDYGPGTTLEYRPIAAVIPPADKAETGFLERMAFRRINNVKDILIVCHSDCGGAKAAIQNPQPDPKSKNDKDIIARASHRSGLDIPKLSPAFKAAAGGDELKAADMMAKEIGLQSMKNIMGYDGLDNFITIKDEVDSGTTTVTLVYYDLASRSFEKYDPVTSAWTPVTPPPAGPQPGKDVTNRFPAP